MAEQDPFDAAANRCFQQAERMGFPAFAGPVAESSPANATPYLCRYRDFRETASHWPGREPLLAALDKVRTAAQHCGVVIEAILIGGSFVDLARTEPRDVDCVMFYRQAHADRPVQARRLSVLQRDAKASRVDVRFIPVDCGPLPLIKSVSYFTALFSMDKQADGRADAGKARGLLLLDCAD